MRSDTAISKCIDVLRKHAHWRTRYHWAVIKYAVRSRRWWPGRKTAFIKKLKTCRPELLSRHSLRWYVLDHKLSAAFLGCGLNDWFSYHFFERNWKERNKNICEERLRFIIRYFNDGSVAHFTQSKNDFAEHWHDFFKRRWCLFDPDDPISQGDFVSRFAGTDILIAKPAGGMWGEGIFTVDFSDPASAYQQIKEKNEKLMVEEYIHQKGFMHELNPSSLNTNRIITIRLGEEPELLSSGIRIGRPGSLTDNIHGGGVLVRVDKNTGVMDYASDYSGNNIEKLPGLDIPVHGTKMPDHDKIVSFCLDAHRIAPKGLRIIGWDVCYSDDGLFMIEGNHWPGFADVSEGFEDPWKTMKGYLDAYDRIKKA